jgi:CRISPR/Cas system-associated endoribonuclease Cas2
MDRGTNRWAVFNLSNLFLQLNSEIILFFSHLVNKIASLIVLLDKNQRKENNQMKKATLFITMTIIMIFFTVTPASARKIHNRLDRQSAKINRGVSSGELTRNEENRLWDEHYRIRNRYDRALRDGWLNRREKRRLNRLLDEANAHIYALKHNRQKRYVRDRHHHRGHVQINSRLDRQDHRIDQGVLTGELTRSEVKRLKKEQRKIRRERNRALKHGGLSRREIRRLNHMLDRASENIYALKHNHRTRHVDRWDRRTYSSRKPYPNPPNVVPVPPVWIP